ncbi:ATP-dependent sacrificial sulfur transferase LarE [Nitrospira sp. Kam-Ns4a]
MPLGKLERMRRLMEDLGSVIVAYSGGVDSSLVLKVAHDQLGDLAVGVTAVSPTFPELELETARRVAAEVGARHVVIETDQLAIPDFVRNEADRCFHCKSDLYEALGKLRDDWRINAIVDGTNLDDLSDDRPGIQAARQLGVRSPLVEAELSKEDIRSLARELGLSNWDKPAAACLSSRIPRGAPITRERLSRVEQAEAVLAQEGFRQVRVRDHGDLARIELASDEVGRMLEKPRRARIAARLKALGFRFVTLDLEGYKQGGANW